MNTSLIQSSPLPPHYAIIDRADLQPSTKHQYTREIDKLIASRVDPRNRNQLADYAAQLSSSSKSFLKAALSLLFADTITSLKASARVDNLAEVQAALLNIEAMDETIKVHQPDRERTPHWLTQAQVNQITAMALQSTRDYIVLAVLFGAGLRRKELEELTFDSLSQIDNKNVLTIRGKGDKVRVIQIASALASHLREWKTITGGGNVARSINKAGKLGDTLSDKGIFDIVRKYGSMIGTPDLDPHDCRRTYGRLLYEATGHDIIRVMHMMGHADVSTTQEYIGLNISLDLDDSVFTVDVVQVAGD